MTNTKNTIAAVMLVCNSAPDGYLDVIRNVELPKGWKKLDKQGMSEFLEDNYTRMSAIEGEFYEIEVDGRILKRIKQ